MIMTNKDALLDELAARVRNELRWFGFMHSDEMMFLKARIALAEAWDAGYEEATTLLGQVNNPNC